MLTQSMTSGATPFLYGVINDKYKNQYPWLAMVSVMSLQFVAVPFLIILAILRNRKLKEIEEQEDNYEDELVDEDEKEINEKEINEKLEEKFKNNRKNSDDLKTV